MEVFQATYWRLPASMTAVEMRQRAELIQNFGGADTKSDGNDDEFEELLVSDSETEDDLNEINETPMKSHGQVNKLIYDESDDDDNHVRGNVTAISTGENMDLHSETDNANPSDTEINTEDIRSRLNSLLDSEDSDHSGGSKSVSGNRKATKRRRIQAFESDSDNDENVIDNSSTQMEQIRNEANVPSAIAAKKKKAIIESDDEE